MPKGYKHTEEIKKKISNAGIGRILSLETRMKISKSNTGKVRSEEAKKRMSEAHKGKTTWNKGIKTGIIPHSVFKKGHLTWNKGDKHNNETREKMRLAKIGKIGENANAWKGGKTPRDKHYLSHPEYRKWRKGVFYRDNFKCRIENKDCKGRLEAHHILGWSSHPELRYQINNGIALCQAHHPRKRAEEKRLSPYFQDLVSVLKVQYSI